MLEKIFKFAAVAALVCAALALIGLALPVREGHYWEPGLTAFIMTFQAGVLFLASRLVRLGGAATWMAALAGVLVICSGGIQCAYDVGRVFLGINLFDWQVKEFLVLDIFKVALVVLAFPAFSFFTGKSTKGQ